VKIACVTDDGQTISAHFGRALYYLVATIEEGQIVSREMREKMGHQHFVGQEHQEAPGVRHGTDPASHSRHASMADAISDCEVLLTRGMGWGAHQSLGQFGIRAIVTDVADIDEALAAYLAGDLEDHTERLH
jgi:predicted Fe-Mo cluster-binding NifX family protein